MKLERATNSNKPDSNRFLPWPELAHKLAQAMAKASPEAKARARQSAYRLLRVEATPQFELERAGQLRLFSNGGATAPKADLSKP